MSTAIVTSRETFAELSFEDLSGHVLRKGIDEFHPAGHLEPAEMLTTVGDDVLRRGGDTLAKDHHRAHHLPPGVVADTDRGRLGHTGVPIQGLFDRQRGDVLAATDNEVLFPVDDIDEALVVLPDQVAGAEPAVGEGTAVACGSLQ